MKVLILHTGGTIAMSEDEKGVAPTAENPLSQFTFSKDADIELTSEEIFNVPSPHMTEQEMLLLEKRILASIQQGFKGVVITHGTDTLEETAYFLHATIGDKIPIVVTGAMRSSNELGSDGLYNLTSAIRVASCKEARGKGVLVVLNDEIHSAEFVTKTHTTNVATFQSPTFGPVGILTKKEVRFFQTPAEQIHHAIYQCGGHVPIIKSYAGMNETFLDLFPLDKIQGLVIEALGAGNLPPRTLPALEKMMKAGIPVVLVSRCFNGIAEPVYSYPGGGIQLEEMGVIFAPALNAQKARIKLLIALNAGLNAEEFRAFLKD